jgi:hypothetical protein
MASSPDQISWKPTERFKKLLVEDARTGVLVSLISFVESRLKSEI